MKEYLKTALKLEEYRYSIVTAKSYALHEKSVAEQQANALNQQYLEDGIRLAAADESDYINNQRKVIGSVARMAILGFIFSALALLFIGLEIALRRSGKKSEGILLEMSIIPICLAIAFFISARSKKKRKSEDVLSAQYNQKYQQATKEWDNLGKEAEKKQNRAAQMDVRAKELSQQEASIVKSLEDIYAENVLDPTYRRLDYIGTLYGYIQRGRCTTVKGHGGIYDTLETELKQNAIILGLDRISRQLNAIRANQRYLYDAIQEGNQIARNIRNEIEAGNRANQQLLSSMALEQKRHNAMQEWQNTRAYYGY